MSRKAIMKIITMLVAAATLAVAVYIMVHRIGLADSLDFGAGAYYYADIPEFDKLEEQASFTTSVPLWAHIVLFLGWGFLMYRLWLRVDRGSQSRNNG